MSKPALPPRTRGIQSPCAPQLPVRPPALPARIIANPTEPLRAVSAKPIIPPRVPLNGNGPSLPARNKTVVVTNAEQKICGRQKPAKYEERDFEMVDTYVRSLPEYSTPRELAHALTCNFPDIIDKYRAVFDWVAFNIVYDLDSFLNNRVPPQSADSTFKNKLAVCAGYSQLFQQLCDFSNLHCIEVSGFAKGFGFNPSVPLVKGLNHAWNAIFVDNEWRMIDATWGAGGSGGQVFEFKFNKFFFLTDPEEFIYQHMPMDDSQQFTASRFTWDEFFAMNDLNGLFFRSGIQMLNHNDCGSLLRPTQGQEIELQLLVPEAIDVMFGFNIAGQEAPSLKSEVPTTRPGYSKIIGTFRVNNVGPSSFTLFSREKTSQSTEYGSLMSMHLIITPHPSGSILHVPNFPKVHTAGTRYSVVSPLVSPLQPRVTYTFVVKDLSPDAQRRNCDLCLWITKPGAPLKKMIKDGQVTYEVTHHVTSKEGEITVKEKRGNAFWSVGTWQF